MTPCRGDTYFFRSSSNFLFSVSEVALDADTLPFKVLQNTRYFLPVKIVNTTCDIFLPLSAFLFFCCVCVADQNTRALLLHAYCYCLATRRLAVTHHPTYTQHEKREAKEKWQRRQTVENRTYVWDHHGVCKGWICFKLRKLYVFALKLYPFHNVLNV